MGPIAVAAHLSPHLPGRPHVGADEHPGLAPVSAAPWGSASILLISYAYICLLGGRGMTEATRYAILNANYLKSKLEGAFDVLYTRTNGRVAHELIFDLRPFKDKAGITEQDVAKRLMDYGFHAPTVSFPVPGTLMVEPTESEPRAELDRFCEAMLAIRSEIEDIAEGRADRRDNVLRNAPHTADDVKLATPLLLVSKVVILNLVCPSRPAKEKILVCAAVTRVPLLHRDDSLVFGSRDSLAHRAICKS